MADLVRNSGKGRLPGRRNNEKTEEKKARDRNSGVRLCVIRSGSCPERLGAKERKNNIGRNRVIR